MTTPRAATGPMTFGDDWPGVFIRGDAALGYASLLTDDLIASAPIMQQPQLRDLRAVLRACCVGVEGAEQAMRPFDAARAP